MKCLLPPEIDKPTATRTATESEAKAHVLKIGTDRASVTAAAGVLQRQKIIKYTRGSVRALNRKALEESSCECYSMIREYNGELIR